MWAIIAIWERKKLLKGNKKNRPKSGQGQLRIIGGEWRSRRLPVADIPGLRPTPDRLRETLFNWLQFKVPGAKCLDLFAGSGALGFEALSRGAAEVVMVEKNATAHQQLTANARTLACEKLTLLQEDAINYLSATQHGFDLIFLDPPFRQQFWQQILPLVFERKLLKQGAWLYSEYEIEDPPDFSGYPLDSYRSAKAGQVQCALLQLSKCVIVGE